MQRDRSRQRSGAVTNSQSNATGLGNESVLLPILKAPSRYQATIDELITSRSSHSLPYWCFWQHNELNTRATQAFLSPLGAFYSTINTSYAPRPPPPHRYSDTRCNLQHHKHKLRTSPAPPPSVTVTRGRRVFERAASAAALSAPSTPPPSFSTSASTLSSQTALPGMMARDRRSKPPFPVVCHKAK